jgi:hypothetical protein
MHLPPASPNQHDRSESQGFHTAGPFVRTISSSDITYKYWRSWSTGSIISPGISGQSQLGDLYVHSYNMGRDIQVWVSCDAGWKTIREGNINPDSRLGGYVFLMKNREEPGWIKRSTLSTYRSRAKLAEAKKAMAGRGLSLVTWLACLIIYVL